MGYKRFRREPIRKNMQCRCGNQAKLVKRTNYPFGRNSVARSYQSYKCGSCSLQWPLNAPLTRK